MKNKIRVMIVDDHPVVREGLKQLLELGDKIVVVSEAGTGLECLELIKKSRPNVIFLDIGLPGINGIETAKLISRNFPSVNIVFLTVHEDDHLIAEAIRAGGKAYLLKKTTRDELMMVINHVMSGGAFLDPTVTKAFFGQFKEGTTAPIGGKDSQAQLTRREFEILQEIVQGEDDLHIAESLFISVYTVRSHIKNIYRKLNVSSRSKAIAKAFRDKIIS